MPAAAPHRDHARKMARLVFARSGILKPPVDVRLIAKNEGLDYDEVDFFSDDVDALIGPVKGRIVAVVNKNQPLTRRRFSLAHELYHYLEGEILVLEDRYTTGGLRESEMTKAGKDPREVEADTFAGDLLVPKALLKDYVRLSDPRGDVADLFEVSLTTVEINLDYYLTLLKP